VRYQEKQTSRAGGVIREGAPSRRWYTVAEVAEMLGFGLTKTKLLVARGEIHSLKDGRSRRILPEWVDEYVARKAAEAQPAAASRWSA
jgi:excisionase family DNA binding protein